jgi:hypothetical protein
MVTLQLALLYARHAKLVSRVALAVLLERVEEFSPFEIRSHG